MASIGWPVWRLATGCESQHRLRKSKIRIRSFCLRPIQRRFIDCANRSGLWHDADGKTNPPRIGNRPLILRAERFAKRNVAHAAVLKAMVGPARGPGASA